MVSGEACRGASWCLMSIAPRTLGLWDGQGFGTFGWHSMLPPQLVCCRLAAAAAAEFVGCSPSLSGAIRVNPWSIDAVADAMYSAIKTSTEHRQLRHDKHWK